MYIKNSMGPRTVPWGGGHTGEDRMGGGLRPFRNNSLRSPLQHFLNPGMCGSSDAVPVELIL